MTRQPATPVTGLDAAQLITAYQAGVWRYLRALGCDRSLADDLTQETFLAVLQRPFEEVHPAATAAFLRKVAHNFLVSHYRKAGRMVPLADMEEVTSDWTSLASRDGGEELLAALRACLEQLSDRAQAALRMRFAEHRSRDEIARELQIGEHGAKNLMQRAKAQLRSCVEGKIKT